MQIRLRDPLAFPVGCAPGFDPTHVALSSGGIVRASCIAAPGGGFVNLLTGAIGTINTGALTTFVDGVLGPSWHSPTVNQTNCVYFTGVSPSGTDSASTLACMIRWTAATQGGDYLCVSGSNNSGPGLKFNSNAAIIWNNYNGTNPTASLTVTAGVPYLILGSSNSVTCNLLAVNLSTGQIITATSAGAALVASDGRFIIGNSNTLTNTNSPAGNIAAAAYISNGFLSMNQLLAWAADPWSFWYPTANDDIFAELVGVLAAQSSMVFPFNTDVSVMTLAVNVQATAILSLGSH